MTRQGTCKSYRAVSLLPFRLQDSEDEHDESPPPRTSGRRHTLLGDLAVELVCLLVRHFLLELDDIAAALKSSSV